MRIVVRRNDCAPKIVALGLTRTQEVVLKCLLAASGRSVSVQQLQGLCYGVFARNPSSDHLFDDVQVLAALLHDAAGCEIIQLTPHAEYRIRIDEARIEIPKRYWSEF